jgi:ABC-type cobalamin/Fe3+-siderophores transport system ATPase subunit
MTDDAILRAEELSFSYGELAVLRELTLSLPAGSFCGLIGPNGSGKSTLLRVLAGVLAPTGGRIELRGRPLASIPPRERATLIGYVPQQQRSVFPFTALEVVLTGRTPYTSRFRFESEKDREIALGALEDVGAAYLAPRPITELSGGEQQMVSVARALAQNASLLLLDEPAAALDLKHRAKLGSSLLRLRKERGLSALVVTHDLQSLESSFDELFVMREGRIVARGAPRDVLREEVLARAYDDTGVRTGEIGGRIFVWSEW